MDTKARSVDPLTADLLRVVVIPFNPNQSVPNICAMETQMTYAGAATEHGKFMFPSSTTKNLLIKDGTYFENRNSYSGCREYTSESVVSFDGPVPQAKPSETPKARVSVRTGTKLDLALVSTIDSNISSAGDVVEAAITKDIRDASGQMMLHAGTKVRGHLTQMEHRYFPRQRITVGIRFDAIMLDSGAAPVSLAPLGSMDVRGRGIFVFREQRAVLGHKFVSHWIVLRAPLE